MVNGRYTAIRVGVKVFSLVRLFPEGRQFVLPSTHLGQFDHPGRAATSKRPAFLTFSMLRGLQKGHEAFGRVTRGEGQKAL